LVCSHEEIRVVSTTGGERLPDGLNENIPESGGVHGGKKKGVLTKVRINR